MTRPPMARSGSSCLRRWGRGGAAAVVVALAGGAGFVACASPVQDDMIEALGPEAPGESEGEFHRYGQPCLVCHGGYGPGSPQFSFGGTVFAQPDVNIPVAGAKVTLTDSTGQKTTMTSNCAGNFYVEQASYAPVYPVRVEVVCTTKGILGNPPHTYRNVMGTRVNRDGACASCHEDAPPGQTGPGRVYCMDARVPNEFAFVPGCAGGPKLEDLITGDEGTSVSSGSSTSTGEGATTGGEQ